MGISCAELAKDEPQEVKDALSKMHYQIYYVVEEVEVCREIGSDSLCALYAPRRIQLVTLHLFPFSGGSGASSSGDLDMRCGTP